MGSRAAHDSLQDRLFIALDGFAFAGEKWFHLVRSGFLYSGRDVPERDVDVVAFRTLNPQGKPVVNEAYAFEVKSGGSIAARRNGIEQLNDAAWHFTSRLEYDRFFGYLVTNAGIEEIVRVAKEPIAPPKQFHDFFRELPIAQAEEHVRTYREQSGVYVPER